MASQQRRVPGLRALLIGVDCYLPNQLPDGTFYRSLTGCVRDVLRVEQFLRDAFGLADERLIRLTASNGDDGRPPEPPDRWPTYNNILAAFRDLEAAARPGEQLFIHYSGHGGRVLTLPRHRELIPYKVIDEALVPTDLGHDDGRYLRDIELAFLLQRLVEKNLNVTIVLDSCHSGSATRGEGSAPAGTRVPAGAVVRGSATVDNLYPAKPSLVASDEELTANWLRLSRGGERDFYVGSGWLPDPRGYVLLAACRAHEGAYEYHFDGVNKQGVLTYWLLDSLKKFGDGVTYRALHRYIHAKVRGQFRDQNPQLEGEGDRTAFGCEPAESPHAFIVLDADEATGRITLSAGRAHGLGAGARFALFGAGEVDFRQADGRLATIEITEPGVASSAARLVVRAASDRRVEQGDWAVLLAPGTDAPRHTVRVIAPEGHTPAQAAATDELARLVRRGGEGYLQLIEGSDDAADFIVSVSPQNHFIICDSTGAELPNLAPPLNVSDADAARRAAARLLHLAKYRNVRRLANLDPVSPLARKFSAELKGVQTDYRFGTPPKPRPFDESAGVPAVKVGEWIFLRARNDTAESRLNVTVLNLRPDWSVRQVFPSGSGLFELLEPGQELLLPLCADLPADYDEGVDLIKVFATVEPTDFHFFELPSLGDAAAPDPPAREETFDARPSRGFDRAPDAAETRDVAVAICEVDDWSVRQFEVRVTR
jgi:hypothetical protein